MHVPIYTMPTMRQVQQRIQEGDYIFPLILRMFICISLLLSIIVIFLQFVWQ